jgi:hypothetical protein
MKRTLFGLCLLLLTQLSLADQTPSHSEPSHSQVRHGEFSAEGKVYDMTEQKWVNPLEFWHNYAQTKGGLTWGTATRYPNYADVSEFDTLIIEVAQGPCLMEFFHSRWRRANDVQRWNPKFSEVLGCANVFD